MTVAEWRNQEVLEFSGNAERTERTWSSAIVEAHDGYWTVRDPQTGIFGTGEDEAAAIEDFKRAVDEHLDVLERQPDLSAALSSQLAYIRSRLA
jgi:hypothetical protein